MRHNSSSVMQTICPVNSHKARPIISIIIPVYNVENYLVSCLDSIINQDLTDCEIILVNDGSTDSSLKILIEYQKRYPNLIKVISQTNGRQAKARNTGIKASIGDYVYFIDSDDMVCDGLFQYLISCTKKYPKADILQFDFIALFENNARLFSFNQSRVSIIPLPVYFEDIFCKISNITPGPVTFLYSKNHLINNNLFYREGLRYEDRMFLYQLIVTQGYIAPIHSKNIYYKYRVGREGSTTTSLTVGNFLDRQYIWREATNLFKSSNAVSKVWHNNLLSYSMWVLSEASEHNFEKYIHRFYTRKDLSLLKKGIISKRDKNLWLLAFISPKLTAQYLANKCPSWKRRLINRTFTLLSHIYIKND